MSTFAGTTTVLPFQFTQNDLVGGVSLELHAPESGYISEVGVAVHAAITTGGTITVLLGASAVAVAGLSVAVANGATKGTRASDTPTPGSATRYVNKGDRIQIKPTSFATAGILHGWVKIASADTSPAL